jgi:hypothetical protein
VITNRYAILNNLVSDTDTQQLPEQQYKTETTRSWHVKQKSKKIILIDNSRARRCTVEIANLMRK